MIEVMRKQKGKIRLIDMNSHMVVDTMNGLKIVRANSRNFFSSSYAVQFVGSEDECKKELKRLKNLCTW